MSSVHISSSVKYRPSVLNSCYHRKTEAAYLEDLISEVLDHVLNDFPVDAPRTFVRSNVNIVVVKISVRNVNFEVVRFEYDLLAAAALSRSLRSAEAVNSSFKKGLLLCINKMCTLAGLSCCGESLDRHGGRWVGGESWVHRTRSHRALWSH